MSNDEIEKDREHYRQLAEIVPTWIWDTVLSIAVQRGDRLAQHGTGSLLSIGQERFIVTAAHVVRMAIERNLRLYCSLANGVYHALSRDWICSLSSNTGTNSDAFDVAVYKLDASLVHAFSSGRCARSVDVEDTFDEEHAVYSLFGFPQAWTENDRADRTVLAMKRLEFVGYTYTGDVRKLEEFQPEYHLAIRAKMDEVRDENACETRFTTLGGFPLSFPKDLQGISGCPVWRVGDRRLPITQWKSIEPKLVAVEGAAYESGVIKATRWKAISTLIYQAFPEIRPAFELFRPL